MRGVFRPWGVAGSFQVISDKWLSRRINIQGYELQVPSFQCKSKKMQMYTKVENDNFQEFVQTLASN